jgi:hypothetical protein
MLTDVDIVSLFIILTTASLSYRIGDLLKLGALYSLSLFVWHTVFCIVYFRNIQSGGDALDYYDAAALGNYDWSPGTNFVKSLTTLLVSPFQLSQLDAFLIYNFFGVAGLLIFANIVFKDQPRKKGWSKMVFHSIVLLPSLSFWSSAIGKDSIAFLGICLALFAFSNISSRKFFMVLGVLLVFFVRPHIAFCMLVASAAAFGFSNKIKLIQRIMLSVLVSVVIFASTPFIISYVGLDDAPSLESTSDYVDKRQSYNMDGGGGLNISHMSLPVQMFTYLFRPLFFDAPNFFWVAASVENLMSLCVCIYYLMPVSRLILRNSSPEVRFGLCYTLLSLIILCSTTANLGIAVRQKTMVLPAIFLLATRASSPSAIKDKAKKRKQIGYFSS